MADTIDQLTEQAIEARATGDTAGAAAAFRQRDVIAGIEQAARAIEREREQDDLASELALGEEAPQARTRDEMSLDEFREAYATHASEDDIATVRENMSATPEGRAMAEQYGRDFGRVVGQVKAAAANFERQNPQLAAMIENAVVHNPTIFPEVFEALAKLGAGNKRSATSPQEEGAPMEYQYRNDAKGDLKSRLAQLQQANPVGSQGYKQNQAEIQHLFRAIYGDKPIVGRQNRNI